MKFQKKVKTGNLRTVHILPIRPSIVKVALGVSRASKPVQLIKVNNTMATVDIIKILRLNFFISF
jgi:hypothetical protein